MATAEHPLEGSPNYCKHGHDLFRAFWRSTVERDRWMENLNLDRPKLFQQQREDDSTREKPTRSPVCQSHGGSEQRGISWTTAEEGSKAVQTFTGRPWNQLVEIVWDTGFVCLPSLQLPKSSAPFGLLTMHDSVCNTDLIGFLWSLCFADGTSIIF